MEMCPNFTPPCECDRLRSISWFESTSLSSYACSIHNQFQICKIIYNILLYLIEYTYNTSILYIYISYQSLYIYNIDYLGSSGLAYMIWTSSLKPFMYYFMFIIICYLFPSLSAPLVLLGPFRLAQSRSNTASFHVSRAAGIEERVAALNKTFASSMKAGSGSFISNYMFYSKSCACANSIYGRSFNCNCPWLHMFLYRGTWQ